MQIHNCITVCITAQIDDENASKRVGLLHRLRLRIRLRLWARLDYAYGLHFDMLPFFRLLLRQKWGRQARQAVDHALHKQQCSKNVITLSTRSTLTRFKHGACSNLWLFDCCCCCCWAFLECPSVRGTLVGCASGKQKLIVFLFLFHVHFQFHFHDFV